MNFTYRNDCVPLAQVVVALPLSVLLLCHPLVLRRLNRRCHRCRASVRWLVVALFSAIQFCHCMLSCDRRHSRCRPLSPIIVFHLRHRRHRRLHRCRRAATTATAAAGVEVIVINCRRKRHKQHHQQLTNGSTIFFTFTFPVILDLFNLSTLSCGSILANILSDLHTPRCFAQHFGVLVSSYYHDMSAIK